MFKRNKMCVVSKSLRIFVDSSTQRKISWCTQELGLSLEQTAGDLSFYWHFCWNWSSFGLASVGNTEITSSVASFTHIKSLFVFARSFPSWGLGALWRGLLQFSQERPLLWQSLTTCVTPKHAKLILSFLSVYLFLKFISL